LKKKTNVFHCTHWQQDLIFNFPAVSSASAVSTVMLQPWVDSLN